jgi:hypothetical protein
MRAVALRRSGGFEGQTGSREGSLVNAEAALDWWPCSLAATPFIGYSWVRMSVGLLHLHAASGAYVRCV